MDMQSSAVVVLETSPSLVLITPMPLEPLVRLINIFIFVLGLTIHSSWFQPGPIRSAFQMPVMIEADHVLIVLRQLNDGIRMLQLQAHNVDGAIKLCHSTCVSPSLNVLLSTALIFIIAALRWRYSRSVFKNRCDSPNPFPSYI